MSFYLPAESLFVFDAIPPRQYVGAKAWRKNFEGFLAEYPGPNKFDVSELSITTDGKLAFAHYVVHISRRIACVLPRRAGRSCSGRTIPPSWEAPVPGRSA